MRRSNEDVPNNTDVATPATPSSVTGAEIFDIDVTTHGQLPGAEDYAREKIGALGRFVRRPVLYARVRLTSHAGHATDTPVLAQANLDVNGRPVRAQVEGPTAREAIDRLEARLRQRLEHIAEQWDVRRHGAGSRGASEHRPSHIARPAEERQVIKHKSYTLVASTVDEAVQEMTLLDYDFHLFAERSTGQDAVLYRSEPAGWRLALVKPVEVESLSVADTELTVSPQPAPQLSVAGAAERLGLLGLPFVFFADDETGRGCVLYHRFDGHYGLVVPAN